MPDTTRISQKLSSHKIQPTAMRTLVLDYLFNRESAVSLTDLEHDFQKSDRTTLYRTLKTFQENGIVHQIHDESGHTKYALCAENCTCSYPDDMHIHFYCSTCGKTSCFTELKIPHYTLPNGFTPNSSNFVITGTCPSCN